MQLAYNLTRSDVCYRHDAFSAGLAACGYEVRTNNPEGKPGRVLLIWSRYGQYHDIATKFEAAGGRVLVAENGYIGPGGISPHSMNPRCWYALGRGAHNDATAIPYCGPERWAALGVELQPWRTDGGHILVCPNRSFGIPERMMPSDWANDVVRRLRKVTQREIRVRPHPGNGPAKKPLADDLVGAWACVIWSSSSGVSALVAGVPVVCEAPYWIAKDAALSFNQFSSMAPHFRDRLPALQRLSWGQWHIDEIASGEAFRAVLA